MNEKNTPLYKEHAGLKALMAPFAGWNMPIHYGSIIEEARHTRKAVSIFDISHMGELFIKEEPPGSALDSVITVPVIKMGINSCRYGFLLNDNGGIIDDLIVYRIEDGRWMVVVNASNEKRDAEIIGEMLSGKAEFSNRSEETVKIDVQGPGSQDVMITLAGKGIKNLNYYTFGMFELYGAVCIISRTGYTGEDGYEIYIDTDRGPKLWQELLKNKIVRPAGLGARDILRVEAGLPLYGHELTEETTPLESGMARYIDFDKDFPGRDALLKLKQGSADRNLYGFVVDGRRAPRADNNIMIDGVNAGRVTSGLFSPHLEKGIGMGYILKEHAIAGKEISIDTGRGTIEAKITNMPFVAKKHG